MNGVNPTLDVIARAKGQVDIPPEDIVREAAWRMDLERYKAANPTLPVPPMLVGIAGKYGSGKSSIICYLVSQLRRYNLFHKVYYFSDSGQLDSKMKEFCPVDNENFHYSPENISTLLGEAYKNKGEKPPWEGGSGGKRPPLSKSLGAPASRMGSLLTSGGVNRGLPGKIQLDGPAVRAALATRHIKPGHMYPMPTVDRAGAVLPLKERMAKERARISNKILYIFDDATGHMILRNSREGNPWAPFFTSLRHLGASVIACYHEYKALGTLQRNNMSATVTFKAGNPEELKKIAHESEMSKDSYELLMRAVSRIPHAFLGTHRDRRPEAERFVLNFQRVIEPAVMEEVIRRERELAKRLRDAGGEEDIQAVFGLGENAGGTAVLPSVAPMPLVGPDLLADPSFVPPGLTPRELAAVPEARSLIASVEALTRPNDPNPERMAQQLGITSTAPRSGKRGSMSPTTTTTKRQKTTTLESGAAPVVVVPVTNNGGSARDHNSSMAAVRQVGPLAIRKPSSVVSREAVRRVSGARAVIGQILRAATSGTAAAERAAVGSGLRVAVGQQMELGNAPGVQALIKRLRVVRSGRAPRGVVSSIGRGVGVNLNKVTYRTDRSITRAAILPGILRGPRDGSRRAVRGASATARTAIERSARLAQTEASLLGIRQELERFKRPPAEEAAKQLEVDRIKQENAHTLALERLAQERVQKAAGEEALNRALATGQATTQEQLTRLNQQVAMLQGTSALQTAAVKASETARRTTEVGAQAGLSTALAGQARAKVDADFAEPVAVAQGEDTLAQAQTASIASRAKLRQEPRRAQAQAAAVAAEAAGNQARAESVLPLAGPLAATEQARDLARLQQERLQAELNLNNTTATAATKAEEARLEATSSLTRTQTTTAATGALTAFQTEAALAEAAATAARAARALQEAQSDPIEVEPDPVITEAQRVAQVHDAVAQAAEAERRRVEAETGLRDARDRSEGLGAMQGATPTGAAEAAPETAIPSAVLSVLPPPGQPTRGADRRLRDPAEDLSEATRASSWRRTEGSGQMGLAPGRFPNLLQFWEQQSGGGGGGEGEGL